MDTLRVLHEKRDRHDEEVFSQATAPSLRSISRYVALQKSNSL